METWRKIWRYGAAPLLSDAGLTALATAIESDDPRLLQGATAAPPPLPCVQDWPVEAACLIGLCGWLGDGLKTVAEVEQYFTKMCFDIDHLIGEPAGIRWLLNWFDETPRAEMLRELGGEVWREQDQRRHRGLVAQRA